MDYRQIISKNPECGAKLLVSEYGERLYATAFHLCQNDADAEDLTFRTLEKAIEKIATFGGKSQFFTWLCSILVNFRKMDLRKKGANALVFSDEMPEQPDERFSPAEEAESADEKFRIRRAVAALPDSLRVPVVLFYFDRMGVPEIAELMEIPEGTVYFRLHDARKRIKENLQGFSGTTHLKGCRREQA